MAQAPSLIIQELTGVSPRRVELKGRALPYRPVAWGLRMRTNNTWYPGNPVSTQQVLGPEEPETSMNGMWKDRFLATEVKVQGDETFPDAPLAEDLIKLIYDIQRSGNELRVQWGFEVRSGIMVEFIPSYERLEDVAWSMEWEWNSRNDEEAPRGAEEPDPFSELLSALNRLDDALSFEPLPGLVEDFAAQLLDTIDRVRGTLANVFDLLRTANAVLALPGQVLGALAAAVDSLVQELLEELSRLIDTPASQQSAATELADVLAFEFWKRDVGRSMNVLAAQALLTNETLQDRANPRATQFVTTPADTTLYALSIAFYDTPDFANFLLRTNRNAVGVDDAAVAAGTVIAIPPRPINDPGVDCR